MKQNITSGLLTDLLTNTGIAVAETALINASESISKKLKTSRDWKKVFVETGKFFVENEIYAEAYIDNLAEILSKANMTELARLVQNESGYTWKELLYTELMLLFDQYDVPHEKAHSYACGIMYTILDELRNVAPDQYDRAFLQDLRSEQTVHSETILAKIEGIHQALDQYHHRNIKVYSADEKDHELKQKTNNPKIGISFFVIDDDNFIADFGEHRYDECIYVRAKCREEAIYCIINELWRTADERAIFIIQNEEGWESLRQIASEGNIYISWFYADEIAAISGNTNIFVVTENIPVFAHDILNLRPRTYSTIANCLNKAGIDFNKANQLVNETHGLFVPLKKKLFNGLLPKTPDWISTLSDKIKKTCLLLGQWTECDGDKAVIEELSGYTYDDFINQIIPFTKSEDPLIHIVNHRQTKEYYLASVENTWEYLSVSLEDHLWDKFVQLFYEVILEVEGLLIYPREERLLAEFRGEKLFWSKTLREGMLRTLIMKAYYRKDDRCQLAMNQLVADIFEQIQNVDQWKHISRYFTEFCEISPETILVRLNSEIEKSTGLFELFENQSKDLLFERNEYIDILFGLEQLLTQRQYAIEAFEWLLNLDNRDYEYQSNSVKDIIEKVLCSWYNFTSFQNPEEKAELAKETISQDKNGWERVYSSVPKQHNTIIGPLSSPKYRDYVKPSAVNVQDMLTTVSAYIELLIYHTEYQPERWKKILIIADDIDIKMQQKTFEILLYEITQMNDKEIIQIKNEIRNIIYRHRYYASASWAMNETQVIRFEELLSKIKTEEQEYEYEYLFRTNHERPLLKPIPYDAEQAREENDRATEKLVQDKIFEFKEKKLNLKKLAEICCNNSTSFGESLGKYWSEEGFESSVFQILLEVQDSGEMAVDYYRTVLSNRTISFDLVLCVAKQTAANDETLVKLYRVEAWNSNNLPQINCAEESVKKIFWRQHMIPVRNSEFTDWALNECIKYGTVGSYLELLFYSNHIHPIETNVLYEYFIQIDELSNDDITQISGDYLTELLKPLQEKFLYDDEKRVKLRTIELRFFGLLDWEDMKCFQYDLKTSPDVYAEMVSYVFIKDNDDLSERETSKEINQFNNYMYRLYDAAKFCPCENNGEIDENNLRQWIEQFIDLLKKNHQSSLFGLFMGRLFAYSPIGKDGHMPCEAVRNMIEEYGDERLLSEYQTEVFNQRGIFSPSAGREERTIAERYKENADYLSVKFPKTAKIYYRLYNRYIYEADQERKGAENGWM